MCALGEQASALRIDVGFLFFGEHALEFLESLKRRRRAAIHRGLQNDFSDFFDRCACIFPGLDVKAQFVGPVHRDHQRHIDQIARPVIQPRP